MISIQDFEAALQSAQAFAYRVAGILYISLGKLPREPYQGWATQFFVEHNLLVILLQAIINLEYIHTVDSFLEGKQPDDDEK